MGVRDTAIRDMNALRVFLAVSASGNMTAAANTLDLTQSAVSQAIRQLEEALGTVLIDRSRRPLTPTAAGTVLQRHAARIVEETELLVTLVRQSSSTKMPELRLGITDSFASTVGPSLIHALLETTTRLSFRSGLAHDQVEGLLSRNLDLIVTSDPMEDMDGLDRYLILSEPFLLLLPREFPHRAGELDLRDLATRHSLIRFSARSQIGAQIERHLRRLGIKAPRLLEVDATDSLAAMVSAGLGWAIATPLCLLQVKSRIPKLKVTPFPGRGFVRHLYLIARSGEYGDLPQRVLQLSRDIVRRECLPEMLRLTPWIRERLVIGDTVSEG
jgi:DNA-binding transcriptional LysR family regulator